MIDLIRYVGLSMIGIAAVNRRYHVRESILIYRISFVTELAAVYVYKHSLGFTKVTSYTSILCNLAALKNTVLERVCISFI
ncbi:hypothetical protein ACR2XN_28235, partial [Klebsiella pneumoniae]